MSTSNFQKILDDQLLKEKKANYVFSELKNLIASDKDSALIDYCFTPVYLYLSNLANGGNPSNFHGKGLKYHLVALKHYAYFKTDKPYNLIINGNLTQTSLKHARERNKNLAPIYTMNFGKGNVDKIYYCLRLLRNLVDLPCSHERNILKVLNNASSAERFYEGLFKSYQGSKIITGTGSKIDTRVASKVATTKGLKVERYAHGGDRGFFRDPLFLDTEFSFASKYFVHGRHEREGLRDFVSTEVFGSSYHKLLFVSNNTKNKGWSKDIIYALPSNVHPNYQYIGSKFVDEDQLKIQLIITDYLKKMGYRIFLKVHPKSISGLSPDLKNNVVGIISTSMQEALTHFDNWVFDTFHSSIVEALSACKNVVFFDLGLRLKSKMFEDIYKIICVKKSLNLPKQAVLKSYFSENEKIRRSYARGFFE